LGFPKKKAHTKKHAKVQSLRNMMVPVSMSRVKGAQQLNGAMQLSKDLQWSQHAGLNQVLKQHTVHNDHQPGAVL
jgi:hypothetical protein